VALHAGKRRQGGEEKQIASALITKLSKPGVKVRAGVVARDWRSLGWGALVQLGNEPVQIVDGVIARLGHALETYERDTKRFSMARILLSRR
jgi:hypothetical protein